jgi:cell division protein FtsW (lipid II flippase)
MPTLKKNVMGRSASALLTLATVMLVAGLRWPLVWALLALGVPAGAWAWQRLGAPARPVTTGSDPRTPS